MISNELNRAGKWMKPEDGVLRRSAHSRALFLADLTIRGDHEIAFRAEFLSWRELLAELEVDPDPHPKKNADLLRQLLLFTDETSRLIPHTPGLAP